MEGGSGVSCRKWVGPDTGADVTVFFVSGIPVGAVEYLGAVWSISKKKLAQKKFLRKKLTRV